jgi:predicted component of type VI protein secretion system
MPAADELFRTTAGNGTLVREGHSEEGAERSGRDRGHNPVAPPTAPAAGAAGPTRPAKTVPAPAAEPAAAAPPAEPAAPTAPPPAAPARKVTAPRRPSGRERHDEKITVYVSPDELLGLEHARIMLRGEYGLAVDRGRIVREAVAALLADLDARGKDSILVKRLSAGG